MNIVSTPAELVSAVQQGKSNAPCDGIAKEGFFLFTAFEGNV